jgi:hypothetical protein
MQARACSSEFQIACYGAGASLRCRLPDGAAPASKRFSGYKSRSRMMVQNAACKVLTRTTHPLPEKPPTTHGYARSSCSSSATDASTHLCAGSAVRSVNMLTMGE